MSRTSFRVNPHSTVSMLCTILYTVHCIYYTLYTLYSILYSILHTLYCMWIHTLYCRVWIHSETRTWHNNNIQSNEPGRQVVTTQHNHLASLTKWLSVHLRTKWFWVRIQLQSLEECLIRGTKSWMYFELYLRGLCKTSINTPSNACDADSLILISDRIFQETSLVWLFWLIM